MDVRTNHGSVHLWILTDVNVIAHVQWEESYPGEWSFRIKKNKFRPKIYRIKKLTFLVTNPLLNFLKGGRMTAFLLIMQYLPVLTLARSPRMIASDWTIHFPFRTIFCEPHRTVWRLTLFPEVWKLTIVLSWHTVLPYFSKGTPSSSNLESQ